VIRSSAHESFTIDLLGFKSTGAHTMYIGRKH
jgi:hypothetical protein